MNSGSWVRDQKERGNPRAHAARKSTLARWGKFNLVGAIGIGVQFGGLFLLKGVLHLHYLVATAIAVELAVLHNFIWHERFTWADRVMPHARPINSRRTKWRGPSCISLPRLGRFHLANGAVSILGNLAAMKAMVDLGHMNYLIANAIAIALCSLVNFLLSDQWVFES